MKNTNTGVYKTALFLTVAVFLLSNTAFTFYIFSLKQKNEVKTAEPIFFCGTIDSSNNNLGKSVFKSQCQACHMIDFKIAGPALEDIFDRIPSEQWFDNFVSDEQALINKKDNYTISINQLNSDIHFTHNFKLSLKEMISLKAYIISSTN